MKTSSHLFSCYSSAPLWSLSPYNKIFIARIQHPLLFLPCWHKECSVSMGENSNIIGTLKFGYVTLGSSIALARKFVRVFNENPEWTFWPMQSETYCTQEGIFFLSKQDNCDIWDWKLAIIINIHTLFDCTELSQGNSLLGNLQNYFLSLDVLKYRLSTILFFFSGNNETRLKKKKAISPFSIGKYPVWIASISETFALSQWRDWAFQDYEL